MSDRKLYLGPLTDNRRWDKYVARPDDVYVVTPPKCGTTWMQTIVSLLFSGDPEVETELSVKMPWIDIRVREMEEVAARLEAMPHRRSIKSHTPMDGIPYRDAGQYLLVYRHPLDAHFSYRKHVRNIPIKGFELFYPENEDNEVIFRRFMDGGIEGYDMDAMPLAHILHHYKAALALADHPNVTLFHYADMSRDLAGTFQKVAQLLDISHPPEVMEKLVAAATFDNMKTNAARFAPSGGKGFMKSDSDFFHSGTSGKWEGKLTKDQMGQYNAAMEKTLDHAARDWLEFGSLGKPG
ncbi:MAG: sulfotransferase domain-containing protein [Sulfitobacter sp.]